MLNIPNYQISTQIYESANSLVYRGVRKKDNQPVILKVLKEDYPTPAELTRYRQEYDMTRLLAEVDGVVKAYDLEKHQNTLVMCLEDFGGESFKNLLIEHQFSLVELLTFAIQATDILGQIHGQNIIHKDINPSNLVLNPNTGILKIIDFGIASQFKKQLMTLKNPEVLEGTLTYMSPEQTGRMNRALDYRTDFYSLGATFYELLTGKVPFESTDAMELVHCHIAKTPVPVCEVNPDVPPILSDLVIKLLAKNAEDRYQSAWGIKADLEKVQKNLPGFENLAGLQFELAQNDFSERFQIPQKLYGRENEINTLLEAFERVSQGATEMMLVAGYSGVGKTALVHEVHKPMTSKNGYFVAGKFDQFQKNIPYSALTQAFNEFCRYLLMESAETLGFWQHKILEATGNNGQIIIDVIPDLELVIGPQPAVAKVGPTEAQNRFQMFFLNFIKALCDKEHPFILFIDDLQWVDSGSLNLLKSILLDSEIKHLFIIGAYRDNEVYSSHPFMMAIFELQKANAIINTIKLANLLEGDVNHLLRESLNCETEQAQSLTDLIYQKTQGNAFFTHQFLQTLSEKGLLQFDFLKCQWQWDVKSIKAQNITDNVVELMANKIDKLPAKTSKVLQLAACIGNPFELSLLAIIDEQDQNKTLAVLTTALTEGLVMPLDENYKHPNTISQSQFKFLHDRVQQAAYALIDDERKQAVHLQIGHLLLKNTPTDTLEDKVFEIVGQFNQGLELLNNQTERLKIAKLNLMAGQKAKMATAYSSAFNYLSVGRSLLTKNSWESQYELTFKLYIEAIESAFLNTSFEQAEVLSQVVLQQTKTVLDQAKVHEIQILSYIAQNQMQAAIDTGLQVLTRLEVEQVITPPQTLSIDKLHQLPMMTAADKQAALRILTHLLAPVLVVQPALLPQMAFTMLQLCLDYGNSRHSAFAYVFYGLLLCAGGEQIKAGYQFGQLALNLLERFEATEIKCKVHNLFHVFISHWNIPARESVKALQQTVQIGLETGDLEYAGHATVNYCSNLFLSGVYLDTVHQTHLQYLDLLKKLQQQFTMGYLSIWVQWIIELIGKTDSECFFNESEMLPILQESHNFTSLYIVFVKKMIMSYLFKDSISAVNHADIAIKYESAVAGAMIVSQRYFYHSLALLAQYLAVDKATQANYLDKVTVNQKQMEIWACHAPMNFQHKYDLVEAEKARVLEQNWEAAKLYEQAIAGAGDNQYLQEQALSYELAAKFYLAQGMEKVAKTYMIDAHYCYQQWGALAIITDLETRYPQWMIPKMVGQLSTEATILATRMASDSNKSGGQWLDLNSIMKAAQTLSGEIVLERLLEKLMHIVIENAGAQTGFLLLPQQEQWFIEAEGQVENKEVKVLQSISIENQPMAQTILQYVIRTQENVVLSNASQEGYFTRDAHIIKQHPQSVLCAPLVNQGKLIGILYLENNLTEGAFTPARLEVLKVLSSQLAISIENALLYRTLEQKVEKRTAQLARRTEQLANANEKITVLNEQLKSENLRMSAELDISRHLQQMLLPKEKELEAIDGLDIAGFMEPAYEVGGDYYDVLQHNGRILFGIGDVTGHGLESGALAIMVQSSIRTLLALNETDPVKFFSALNQMVFHNAQRMNVEKSLTLALIDYKENQLYLSGQHEEVIVVRDGELELIDTMNLGFPIGLDEDIADSVNQAVVPLNAGDVVVLYTDGITEAENQDKQMYGLEQLCKIIQQNWQKSAHEIQQAVIDNVRQFIGEQKVFDDITLLVLKQK